MRFTQYPSEDQYPPPVDRVGLSVKQLFSSSMRYCSARWRLLLLETRLAAGELKGALVLCIVATAGAIAGIILLTVSLVLWTARFFFADDKALASAILGAVMLGVAWLLVWRAGKSIKAQNFYPVTKAEFNLDKQCLNDLPQSSHGSNGRH